MDGWTDERAGGRTNASPSRCVTARRADLINRIPEIYNLLTGIFDARHSADFMIHLPALTCRPASGSLGSRRDALRSVVLPVAVVINGCPLQILIKPPACANFPRANISDPLYLKSHRVRARAIPSASLPSVPLRPNKRIDTHA